MSRSVCVRAKLRILLVIVTGKVKFAGTFLMLVVACYLGGRRGQCRQG
jgi:hypothetical protein